MKPQFGNRAVADIVTAIRKEPKLLDILRAAIRNDEPLWVVTQRGYSEADVRAALEVIDAK